MEIMGFVCLYCVIGQKLVKFLVNHTYSFQRLLTTYARFRTTGKTVITDTGKAKRIWVNLAARIFCKCCQVSKTRTLNIHNFAAFSALKVRMFACYGIKPRNAISRIDHLQFSGINKLHEITVNRTQTDMWKLFSNRCIYTVGGRMIVAAFHIWSDGFSLPAVPHNNCLFLSVPLGTFSFASGAFLPVSFFSRFINSNYYYLYEY